MPRNLDYCGVNTFGDILGRGTKSPPLPRGSRTKKGQGWIGSSFDLLAQGSGVNIWEGRREDVRPFGAMLSEIKDTILVAFATKTSQHWSKEKEPTVVSGRPKT